MEDEDYAADGVAQVMLGIQQTELSEIEKRWEEERKALAKLRAQQDFPGLTVSELLVSQKKRDEVFGARDEMQEALLEEEKKRSDLVFQKVGKFPPPPTGKSKKE